jgi:acyl-ACP thioesterase
VRDYDIADMNGTVLVKARSGWLILDIEKRRPLRPQSLIVPIPVNEGLDAMSGAPLGLETRNNLTKIMERKAAYSDIDFNGHMNNARYIQRVQDISDGGMLQRANQIRLDINYLDEIKLNEGIEIWASPLERIDHDNGVKMGIEGRKQHGNAAAFRAELLVHER